MNQTAAVNWFLLKINNSYHDNIEHLVVHKWIATVSIQCGLPEWPTYELLEIYLCEIMKSLWHQPLTRYAWIVEREWPKN